jgi:hypothetical protein
LPDDAIAVPPDRVSAFRRPLDAAFKLLKQSSLSSLCGLAVVSMLAIVQMLTWGLGQESLIIIFARQFENGWSIEA